MSSPRCQRAIVPLPHTGPRRGCDRVFRFFLAADLAVGPEGLEPSLRWLRARYAAANTLVPSHWGRSDSNRDLRRLKVWSAADYATTPFGQSEIVAAFISHRRALQVVRGGIAPASGDVSDRHAPVTTPDRQSGRWESNPLISSAPRSRIAVFLHPDRRPPVARRGIEPLSPL